MKEPCSVPEVSTNYIRLSALECIALWAKSQKTPQYPSYLMQTSVFPFVSPPFEPMNLSENISMSLYTENREDLILHVAVLNPRGKSAISLLSCSGEKHSWSLVRTATVRGVSCSLQHFKSQKTSMGLRRAVNEMSSILIEMDFSPICPFPRSAVNLFFMVTFILTKTSVLQVQQKGHRRKHRALSWLKHRWFLETACTKANQSFVCGSLEMS